MPTMILPLMTGLILFFSGIVIGYLFTYRDRTDEEALKQKLDDDNKRLNREISGQHFRVEELQDELRERQAKLVLLQQVCDDFECEQHILDKRCQKLEIELSSAQSQASDFRKRLTDETRQRTELNDLLHELKQKHVRDLSETEGRWSEQLSRIESKVSQRESEIERFSSAHDRIATQLQSAESKVAELESELRNRQLILETAIQNASGLEKEYVSLESSMRAHAELLNESRGQVATAISAKNLAEDALRDLRVQFQLQQARIQKLEEIESESATTRMRCVALEQSLENSNQRIEQIIAERDTAMSAEKQACTVIGGLRKRTENQELTMRTLREQIAQHDSEVKAAVSRAEHFQTALEQARQVHLLSVESHAETQRELAIVHLKVRDLEDQIDAFESAQVEWHRRLEHLVTQRDQAFGESETIRGQLNHLMASINTHEETIRNLRRERGNILSRSRQGTTDFPRMSATIVDRHSTSLQGSRIDPVRGLIYTEVPANKDDLKKISGIATILEQRLNEFGVYTYQQIMEWDQTAIDEFSVLLAFKDRIQRDNWQGQAKRLYCEKMQKLDQGKAA